MREIGQLSSVFVLSVLFDVHLSVRPLFIKSVFLPNLNPNRSSKFNSSLNNIAPFFQFPTYTEKLYILYCAKLMIWITKIMDEFNIEIQGVRIGAGSWVYYSRAPSPRERRATFTKSALLRRRAEFRKDGAERLARFWAAAAAAECVGESRENWLQREKRRAQQQEHTGSVRWPRLLQPQLNNYHAGQRLPPCLHYHESLVWIINWSLSVAGWSLLRL